MAPQSAGAAACSPLVFPDRQMLILYRGLVGIMTYRSFHAPATWTFSETKVASRPVQRAAKRGLSRQRDQAKDAFHRRWPMTWRGRRQTGVKRKRRCRRPAAGRIETGAVADPHKSLQ